MLQLLCTPVVIQLYTSFSLSALSKARVNGLPISVTRAIFACCMLHCHFSSNYCISLILHGRQPGAAGTQSTSLYSHVISMSAFFAFYLHQIRYCYYRGLFTIIYLKKPNCVSRVRTVAATLWLQYIVQVLLLLFKSLSSLS